VDIIDLIETYRLYRPQLADPAAEQHQYAVRSLERFLKKTPDTSDLTEQTILRFLSARLRQASAWTCKRERGSLLLLWRFAWKRNLCEHDPHKADIPQVKIDANPPIALTQEQLQALLASARLERSTLRGTNIPKADWWYCLIAALYWTGARIGAMIAAEQHDLDRQTGWLLLRAEPAKTGIGQWCQLPTDLAESIPSCESDDRLFPWPYHRRQLFAAMKRIAVRAGLPPSREYRFHCLRRTCATWAVVESGFPAAQRALGHTRESMTRRYVDPRMVRESLVDVLPMPQAM
jgi:integrase